MGDWDAFQADTLDILKQYEGFFDFFERVGSIQNSRPDCLCRVTRENKKEIWIVDAKNKGRIEEPDIERMEKYRQKIKSEPLEIGLDYSEISDHDIRVIAVMRETGTAEEIETVKITALHQFLQKELIYSQTGKVVRDVSKMMKKGQLRQSEARMLYESVEPYRETLEAAIASLESLEEELCRLQVKLSSENKQEIPVPVDCVITHEMKDAKFLIDIPYSESELDEIDTKIDTLKKRIDQEEKEVYYSVISLFGNGDEELIYTPEEIEEVIKEKAGLTTARDILKIFKPNVPVQTKSESGKAEMTSKGELEYHVTATVENDSEVSIIAGLPEEAQKELKNRFLNSRNSFGKFKGSIFRIDFELLPRKKIEGIEGVKDMKEFETSVEEDLLSAVNPVLSREFNHSD